jgi:hypothetical protein
MITSTAINLIGAKQVEVPYFSNQLSDIEKSILIVGERFGEEGISETINSMGYKNVTTTDIMPTTEKSWIRNNTKWNHIQTDFIDFDESQKYDYIIAISVFEHFGFWFAGNRMANGLLQDDTCYWNHDIRGISKACRLLKDPTSKLIITLPAGPYMNYEHTGEPFQRSYDGLRQSLIHKQITELNCKVVDEKFYFTPDFVEWTETTSDINSPLYYPYYVLATPNIIWAFTIQQQE